VLLAPQGGKGFTGGLARLDALIDVGFVKEGLTIDRSGMGCCEVAVIMERGRPQLVGGNC